MSPLTLSLRWISSMPMASFTVRQLWMQPWRFRLLWQVLLQPSGRIYILVIGVGLKVLGFGGRPLEVIGKVAGRQC